MWTRAELKERAKACLSRYYWAAFAVSLIFALVSGLGGGNGNSGGSSNYNSQSSYNYNIDPSDGYGVIGELEDKLPDALDNVPGFVENVPIGGGVIHMGRLFWGIFAGALIVLIIISLLVGIFVAPVMEVGKNRFYMESRLIGQSAGVGKLFWGFSHNYLNIIWTMFLRELFVLLGTICCVIPGIYLSYCYYMVPYILSENPEMKPMEAMRLSKQMMEGHKFNTFVLEISFMGWYLLGLLLCGIGGIFVNPYHEATFAELYAVLRGPYGGGLNGFGYPDVVPTGSFGGTYVNPDNVYDGGSGYGNGQYGGYQQSQGYGQYGAGQQGQGYGYDQYGGYQSGSTEGGQYDTRYGQSTGTSESDQNYGQNGGGWQAAEGGGESGGGYNQGDVWTGSDRQDMGGSEAASAPEDRREDRGTEVSRSEGGPGRGYYLNGVFHPYTEDDGSDR